jgi:CubicO group peptidase (beta-lactamase class C family)
MRLMTIAALAALFLCTDAVAQIQGAPLLDSDPTRLRLMQGFPVPEAAQVRWDDGSMWTFPKTRWSFSHIRELLPTVAIRRGAGPASSLPRAERADLDAVRFTTLDGRQMTWRDSLDANYTDGIVVLYRGKIVYERYFGALGPNDQHVAMSVTKSFVGTLAEALIAEGRLDPTRRVASYVPELAASGFGDATVRQVMDMRTGLQYSESYAGFGSGLSDVSRMEIAAGRVAPPAGYVGPVGNYAYAASIAKSGEHGGDFIYKTPNSIVLGWILERVTGKSLASQIEERVWQPMGMEQDASLAVDRLGTAFSGAGFSASLRDMARFGEMIRLGGRWNGRQILPSAAVQAILRGGDPTAFVKASYPGLEGGSYASQWWHAAGGQTLALGIHGQGIYIDPKAELVIARFASHPKASNRDINPVTIPAYAAIATHLAAHPTPR